MAITTKEEGVWSIDQVYNKQMQGSIWDYDGLAELYSWGRGSGRLGLNQPSNSHRSSPTQVPGSWTGHFSTGSGSSNAVFYIGKETDGDLWTWGSNSSGILGQNNQTNYSSPIQIGGDTTWAQACAGTACYGVKTDGTLWGWGHSDNGATGTGRTARSSPTQIPGTDYRTTDYSICSSGDQNGWALRTDGTMWAWGRNQNGALGQNNNTSSNYPLQIPGTTWDKLADGASQSMAAIKTDGTLWTWGYGVQGQLGHNEQTAYSSPKQVPGTTWRSVRMSNSAAWATKTDGTLWSWGRNLEGQLGQGNPTNTKISSPVQVGSATTWGEKISHSHPSAILMKKTDGTLWSWGYNGYGQLGQNSRSTAPTPQQIPGTLWNSIAGSSQSHFATQLA